MQKRKKSLTKSKVTATCDLLRIHEQMMNSQNRRKNNGRNHYNGMQQMTRNHFTTESIHKASSADSVNQFTSAGSISNTVKLQNGKFCLEGGQSKPQLTQKSVFYRN